MNLLSELVKEMSLESSEIENEIELYISVTDPKDLEKVAVRKEYQEQYGFKVPKSDTNTSESTHRIRYTITDDLQGNQETTYVYTFKMRQEDGTSLETNADVSEEVFRAFKLTADNRMVKRRYVVPANLAVVEGVMFEVDVFLSPDCKWVKVDVELPADVVLDATAIEDIQEKAILAIAHDHSDRVLVTPQDKAERNDRAKHAHEIMQEYAIELGPFTKES